MLEVAMGRRGEVVVGSVYARNTARSFKRKISSAKTTRPMEYVLQISLQTTAAAAAYFYISNRDVSIRDIHVTMQLFRKITRDNKLRHFFRYPCASGDEYRGTAPETRHGALAFNYVSSLPRESFRIGRYLCESRGHA